MQLTYKSFHNRLIKHLREWHRKLGIIAAAFIIFLSVSGVALNHTTSLSLAHQPINNSWLLDHYGILPPEDIRFYQHNDLIVTNHFLWFNNRLLLESSTKIVMAALIPSVLNPAKSMVMVVSNDKISLFNQQGELIDQLGEALGVPQNINAVSINKMQVIVKTGKGYFQTNFDFFKWNQINFVDEPTWILPSEGTENQITKAQLAYRSQFLNLERIILDAHSGRILGFFGVIFMDAVAILLILLSLSGCYIWLRYSRSKR